MESKGASPTRTYSFSSSVFGSPFLAASLTSAHSVGSPTASPESLSSSASEQRAMAVSSIFSSSDTCSTTVILFWVRVPVLSEQIICVHPSVSTAVSFRIMAFLFDMFVTPIESTIVTTAASPSGIAATARETATIKVLRIVSPLIPALRRPTAKITTQIPITRTVSILLSWFSLSWRGVASSFAWERAFAIFPISVFIPVPVTTAFPRPYTTVDPI